MKKTRYSGAVRVFQFFATLIFIFVIIFFTLSLATTKKNLKSLCNKYVREVELDSKYFSNYIDAGYTEEEVKKFLTDDRIYDLVSGVMNDRLLAIFKYSDEYIYTLDMCNEEILAVLTEYNTDNKISAEKLSSLTKYTCDISGISSMFIFDTPVAYRNALFRDENLQNMEADTKILKGLAVLSSWYFLLTVVLMYIIVIAILIFVANKDERVKLHPIIANTSITPSIVLFGISFGEMFGIQKQPIITDYIFKNVLFVSLAGTIVGIVSYFLVKKILIDFDRKGA